MDNDQTGHNSHSAGAERRAMMTSAFMYPGLLDVPPEISWSASQGHQDWTTQRTLKCQHMILCNRKLHSASIVMSFINVRDGPSPARSNVINHKKLHPGMSSATIGRISRYVLINPVSTLQPSQKD
ncbi:hypothetical protein RRG08_007029 [Elysia crispata]|uniref:Uncharacterized protein n=1 Tax=Elysia crispata TaxID=231223 RepID=A0AAE1DGW7_9GAST|nr:hypothetical protein RRG08_007029 [Elysia crispata]